MTIYVDKTTTRITLRSTRPIRGLNATFPGAAYFSESKGCWTLPLDLATFDILAGHYGTKLDISVKLWNWVKESRQTRTRLVNIASGKNRPELTRLPRVAPKLYRALINRSYQIDAINFGKERRAFLIADDPGLGKTLMAIGTVIELNIPGPYLVVCPKTAVDTVWRNELKRWVPKSHVVTMAEFDRSGREEILDDIHFGSSTWVIVNPEMLLTKAYWECWKCGHWTKYQRRRIPMLECGHKRQNNSERIDEHSYPQLFDHTWNTVIVDECHDVLIRKPGEPTQRRLGMESLSIKRTGVRIALSGTPFRGKPWQLWGTINWLDSKRYSGFWRWVKQFWNTGGYTGYQIQSLKKEREYLLWDSLNDIVIKRSKKDVAPDLPPKQYMGTPILEGMPNAIVLPMEPKQQQAYEEMLIHSVANLDHGRLEAIAPIAELARLRQFAASYGKYVNGKFIPILPSNKFNWIIEQMETWGWPRDPDTNIVITSQFTSLLELFGSKLDKTFKKRLSVYITGRVSQNEKLHTLKKFNEYDRQVLFMNMKAGGQSITIDSADRMITVSRAPIPDMETQAEDRIHRVSKPRHCQYYYLHSADTIDIGTAIVNANLDKEAQRLLDRKRGRAYAKRVIELSESASQL